MKKRQIFLGDIEINDLAKKYISQIIKSRRLTYGPFTQKLEKKFAQLHNSRWAIFTSSGTGALQAGIACLKETNEWQDGDEILVPAISFVATANTVYQMRLKPIFVDVDKKTFNIDPSKIEKHLSKKTKAIIPVHLLGLPANMHEIMKIAGKHNLEVIEDSCDAMFVKTDNKPVGSFGEVAAFSTYAAHLLPTGVGGFLIGNSLKKEKIARSYTFHGRHYYYLSIDDDDKKTKARQILKNRFRFDRIGSNFRITEIEAAIGLSLLNKNKHQTYIRKRQQIGKLLINYLSVFNKDFQLPYIPQKTEHAFMMFPIVIKNPSISKWGFISFLEEKGIETRELLPLLNQPAYKKTFGNIEKNYPVAQKINKKGFYFGCHHKMTIYDARYIADIFHEFLSK